jgi:peptidylprolyl isomerase
MRIPVLLLLGVLACNRDAESPAPPAAGGTVDLAAVNFVPALGVDLGASHKLPSGLYYRDIDIGSGPALAAGQQASVHYIGYFPNGTEFDKNQAGSPPFTFRVGNKEVIDGWDQGVVGMQVGGKRQLIVPPSLGYGPNDYGPIPGNSVLVFIVELVAVQ